MLFRYLDRSRGRVLEDIQPTLPDSSQETPVARETPLGRGEDLRTQQRVDGSHAPRCAPTGGSVRGFASFRPVSYAAHPLTAVNLA